ncbi:MAG: 3'-5' exonuclease domain-containing protein 2 [Dysgonamonadaceae bacterium]|jgi:ribonuclease D|nr:3'-5' exonuclease domain-containing protein 2 [Dysgonamonadaceae bacterium]
MEKSISKEELAKLESEVFTGKICVVDDAVSVKRAVDYLVRFPLLGFDTETRPSFEKGLQHKVALIQLANQDHCFLFRVNGNNFFDPLIELLSNPDIKKIGLSLQDDFRSIKRWIRFEPRGFIELQEMVKDYGIDEMGLAKIYALIFGKKISKSQRLTNWEAKILTEAQKHYAALDAWACFNIYKELCVVRKST